MSSKNDNLILSLKEKIELKRNDINVKVFEPKTTCIFNLFGEKYNIHTFNKDTCILWMATFKAMIDAHGTIEGATPLIIDGFDINDWYSDLSSRFGVIKAQESLKELSLMESKLDKLLSSDKKIELELDEIKKMIG